MFDEQTLKNRIKAVINNEKNRLAAHAIELEAQKIFTQDDQFIHTLEAKIIATIDLNELQLFVDRVIEIRADLDNKSSTAVLSLIDEGVTPGTE